MRKAATTSRSNRRRAVSSRKQLPVLVERGEDGFYVVECPVLAGCYAQGKTVDDALRNIREVIALVLEEKEARARLKAYRPTEIGLYTITL